MQSDLNDVVENADETSWNVIKNNLDDNDTLDSLRVLCRQKENAERAQEFLPDLLRLSICGSIGALKVLGNICYHSSTARNRIANDSDTFHHLVENAESLKGESLLFTLRLLFFVTLNADWNVHCDILESLHDTCFKLLNSDDDIPLYALRILFNIETGIDNLDNINDLIRIAEDESRTLKVRGSSINLLLKANSKTIALEGTAIVGLLKIFAKAEKSIFLDYYPSMATLIMRLCREQPVVRKTIKRILLPSNGDNSQEYRNMIIHNLKSPQTDIVMSTGDMVMELVQNNVPRLLFHIGYVHAAGYLYMKDIRVCEDGETDDLWSSDEEDLRKKGIKAIDLINETNEISNDTQEMNEEEKEEEAERLIELLIRMEKSGIVKIIK